jgi:hypothetical protein
LYAQSDPECGGDHTDTTFAKSNAPAQSGYASCGGDRSYMEVFQYLESYGGCDSWEQGNNGIATTVIANNACVYYGTQSGFPVYTRTMCTAEGQTTFAYINDPSCSVSAALVGVTNTELGCSFYANTTSGVVYSAMTRCVIDDEIQRCADPISMYSSHVQFMNLMWNVDMWSVYSKLFPYATLTVRNLTYHNYSDQTIEVNVSFCTEWEDRKYGSKMKSLASYTLTSSDINDNATICANCVASYCVNSTMCGGSSYCQDDCVAPSTTMMEESTTMEPSKDNKSAAALFVSFFTFFFTLLFSVY